MKKIILSLLMIFSSIGVFSQSYYRFTLYSWSYVINNQYSWSNWEKSDIPIIVDIPNYVEIKSKAKQFYTITSESSGIQNDNNGGQSISFNFTDQDGVKGVITFRVDPDNNNQIYIYYSDIAWIYCVVKE